MPFDMTQETRNMTPLDKARHLRSLGKCARTVYMALAFSCSRAEREQIIRDVFA